MKGFLLSLVFISHICSAQNSLMKQWDHRYGGSANEEPFCIKQTRDRGYILGGTSLSDSSGNKTEDSRGANDYWIVKTDSLGIKQWDKRFGGSENEALYSLEQTSDGGYILGGLSFSEISGDKTEKSRGFADYWIVKIDSLGIKQWDKRFGGADGDILTSVHQTPDKGYILGGHSMSKMNGDKSQPSWGGSDYWIVKTDSLGIKQWDKRFGGSDFDDLESLQLTNDGGYILGGESSSGISGDKSQPLWGGDDYWVVKIDSLGNKQWDKRFGGTDDEYLSSIIKTNDGGYILGGGSESEMSGDKTQSCWGWDDYWIVKIDSLGNKQWDKRFGGIKNDDLLSLVQTSDHGYLLSGSSVSDSSGDKSQNNMNLYQAWLVKCDSNGIKQWDKTVFTTGPDGLYDYALQSNDGCFVGAITSQAGIGGDKSEASWDSSADYWLIKFCDTMQSIPTLAPSASNEFSIYPNPSKGSFTIDLSNSVNNEATFIDVINAFGQKVFSLEESLGSHSKKEINLNHAAPGIYFIEIKTGNDLFRKKLVVSE